MESSLEDDYPSFTNNNLLKIKYFLLNQTLKYFNNNINIKNGTRTNKYHPDFSKR